MLDGRVADAVTVCFLPGARREAEARAEGDWANGGGEEGAGG